MKIQVDLKSVKKQFEDSLKVPRAILDDGYDFFVKETPKGDPSSWKTKYPPKNYVPGNARRNTEKDVVNYKITADYPYAERLDNGWSKQSPNGMIKPTIDHIQRKINQYLRGKQNG